MRLILAFLVALTMSSAALAQSAFPLDGNGGASYAAGSVKVIGGRPAGCPRRYCGCGLRKFLGISDKSLDLAANWLRRFPRVAPRPQAVAARRGHVFQLISHISGKIWLVRDYNSGGGLSRIHARSIVGFITVDAGRG